MDKKSDRAQRRAVVKAAIKEKSVGIAKDFLDFLKAALDKKTQVIDNHK